MYVICYYILCLSFSDVSIKYLVDMNSGMCQCKVGIDGAPCKHQYILFARKIVKSSNNFIPVSDPHQRMLLSKIAVGKSLPVEYYEGLHDRTSGTATSLITTGDDVQNCCDVGPEVRDKPSSRTSLPDRVTEEEAKLAIQKSMGILLNLVDEHNQPRMRGIIKFADRLQSMTNLQSSRLEHALHTFGSSLTSATRITSSSIVKRRGKIHVQPEAVKRRRVKNGSRNKLNKGQHKHDPFNLVAGKRKRLHSLSNIVKENVPPSKKAGRSMSTKTRIYESKPPKKD